MDRELEIDQLRREVEELRLRIDEIDDADDQEDQLIFQGVGGIHAHVDGRTVVIGQDGAGFETNAVPCKITSGNSLDGYQVEIYGNGVGKALTGYGVLMILEISATSNLPVGSWVLGFPGGTVVTGGNE